MEFGFDFSYIWNLSKRINDLAFLQAYFYQLLTFLISIRIYNFFPNILGSIFNSVIISFQVDIQLLILLLFTSKIAVTQCSSYYFYHFDKPWCISPRQDIDNIIRSMPEFQNQAEIEYFIKLFSTMHYSETGSYKKSNQN